MKTMYNMYKSTAEKYADLDCTIDKNKTSGEWEKVTYKQWYARVEAMGLALLALGLKKGDKVCLFMDNRVEFIMITAAMNSLGIVDVPRGTDSTTADLEYIANHSEARFAILENPATLKLLPADLPGIEGVMLIDYEEASYKGRPVLSLADELAKGERRTRDEGSEEFHRNAAGVRPDDPLTIVYTSGTTAAPKGVLLEQECLYFNVTSFNELTRIKPGGVILVYLPPWHIGERFCENAALMAGVALAFTTIAAIGKDLALVKPTLLFAVPRVWEKFYQKIQEGGANSPGLKKKLFFFFQSVGIKTVLLKDVITGNEVRFKKASPLVNLWRRLVALAAFAPLSVLNMIGQALVFEKIRGILGNRIEIAFSGAGSMPHHIDLFFRAAKVKILDTYGLTETTGSSTLRDPARPKFNTIGRPLPGVELKLIDQAGNTVTEPGAKGVACIKGPHIMREYYKEAEKTAAVLDSDGWFNSGDILKYTTSGELAFAGREKDTIVLLGSENVEPGPIEAAIGKSIYVEQVVVVGQDRKTLTALIVPNQETVGKYFADSGENIPDDRSRWNDDERIKGLFKSQIKDFVSARTGFKSFERVSNCAVLPAEFTPGAELTNTMKIKRNFVAEKYAAHIDAMYK